MNVDRETLYYLYIYIYGVRFHAPLYLQVGVNMSGNLHYGL